MLPIIKATELQRDDFFCQDLVAGFGIAFFERSFISVLLLYSLVYVVLFSVRTHVINGTDWPETVISSITSAALIAFALAVLAHILRWFAVFRAWKLVIADKERYDIMWQSMISSTESKEWLIAIQCEVSILHPSTVNLIFISSSLQYLVPIEYLALIVPGSFYFIEPLTSLWWLQASQLAQLCPPGDPIQMQGRSWDPFSITPGYCID